MHARLAFSMCIETISFPMDEKAVENKTTDAGEVMNNAEVMSKLKFVVKLKLERTELNEEESGKVENVLKQLQLDPNEDLANTKRP